MVEYPSISMKRTGKLLRRSIYTFLQNYQHFSTTSALLAFPLSASILLSQALLLLSSSSPLLPSFHNHLHFLFLALGFPPSSQFFTIFNLKLSQTITSSLLTLPFTLSFLLLAKASIVHALNHHQPKPSLFSIYNRTLLTQICNSLLLLSANASCFSIFFIAFNCLQGLGFYSPASLNFLTAIGAVLYSIVLANTLIICNLALVSSGFDNCGGGSLAILKAYVLIRGRTATALALALPLNMALAAVEALFQFRVVRAYYTTKNPTSSMALEAAFIAYLYSIIIVIDTIATCVFFKNCKLASRVDDYEEEGRYTYLIRIEERDFSRDVESYVKN